MAIDHSQTYKKISLKNLPHRMRARAIVKTIKKLNLPETCTYFDIGCSNGYLTQMVSSLISATKTVGWDHSLENIQKAEKLYPHLNFMTIDLNAPPTTKKLQADFITCFETIEHVGNTHEAINNIDNMIKPNGQILYTVPIESGLIGAVKYIIKKHLFNYSLEEISKDRKIWKMYEYSLLKGDDISKYRDERNGWGTHFGFDYRNFEQQLNHRYDDIEAWTSGTTRFLLIKKASK